MSEGYKETDTFEYEGPKCPYCGNQYTADEPFFFDELNYTDEECDECGNSFYVTVSNLTAWACSRK